MFIRRRVSVRGVKLYRYQTRREGKRIITTYIGTASAEHEEIIQTERAGRKVLAHAKRERRNPPRDEFEVALDSRLAELRQLVNDAFTAAGWHRHKRTWRSTRKGRPLKT